MIAVASVAALLAAVVALQCAVGDPRAAGRAVLTSLAVLVGVAQGAALLAALFGLADPAGSSVDGGVVARRATLRRTAEVIALALPVTTLAQCVLAGLTAVLAAPAAPSSVTDALLGGDLARAGVACALALVGTAYLDAALAPELLAAHDRGELDGRAARLLARLHARAGVTSERGARWLAAGYVLLYALVAPWTAQGLVGAVRPAGALLGPYIAASDVVLALGVVLAVAAARALSDDDEATEADAELSHAATVLALASVVLGALTLAPLVWALGASGAEAARGAAVLAGFFPTFAPTHAWQALAFCGFVVGYVAPATVLGSRAARASVTTVGLFAALAALGAWLVRLSLVLPARAPGYGLIDLATGLLAIVLGALCVAAVLRSAALETLFEPRPRASHFPRISHAL